MKPAMDTPTVFITGASSGIGLATARYFHEKGWNVVATMRNPCPEGLPVSSRMTLLPLDVTRTASIEAAVEKSIEVYGRIDAVVNNAAQSLIGYFHSPSEAQIEEVFSTNLMGFVRVMRAVISHFRERGDGVFVNVSSIGGQIGTPLTSCYCASKFAMEGFSESAFHELKLIGVRVKLVEPGTVRTPFYRKSSIVEPRGVTRRESDFFERQNRIWTSLENKGIAPEDVARTIFSAALDRSRKLRFVAGNDARIILFFKWLVGGVVLFGFVLKILELSSRLKEAWGAQKYDEMSM